MFIVLTSIHFNVLSPISDQNFIFSNLYPRSKLQPCSCTFKWCSSLRLTHLFGNSTVKIPSDHGETEIWANLLGISNISPTSRVSIIHFFEVDIMVKSDSNGGSVFDSIDRVNPTKYQQFDTGNSSLTSPPRPAAAKSDTENSFFFNINVLTYRDYILQASTWSINKKSRSLKRKESKASANTSTASSQYFDSPPASETQIMFQQ